MGSTLEWIRLLLLSYRRKAHDTLTCGKSLGPLLLMFIGATTDMYVRWSLVKVCCAKLQFVQTIPSATTSTYPVPLPSKRPAWDQFIHGAPRKLKSELAAKAARRAGSCSLSEFGIDEDDEREKKKIRVEVMVDEEEEMRALNEGGAAAVDQVMEEEEEEDDELYEPEELRHRSKEPTMDILRHMNQVGASIGMIRELALTNSNITFCVSRI